MESVFDVVEAVQKKWDANRHQGAGGKFVKSFHKVCGTLDSHSTMLKILPEGNEYISIFTGTLTTVIRVRCHVPASTYTLLIVRCRPVPIMRNWPKGCHNHSRA